MFLDEIILLPVRVMFTASKRVLSPVKVKLVKVEAVGETPASDERYFVHHAILVIFQTHHDCIHFKLEFNCCTVTYINPCFLMHLNMIILMKHFKLIIFTGVSVVGYHLGINFVIVVEIK